MDPNRHHEFIGGNEEKQSAMYFSRGIEESRSNTQYYSQERVIVNNKSCMCPSMSHNNTACNACPSAADGNWNSERTSRIDFQATSTAREKFNQNPMYSHDGRQYFQPNSESIVGLQQDRNAVSSKSCALESNYSFKQQFPRQQPQPQPQQNLMQMQTQSNIANVTNLPPQQLQQKHHQHLSAIGNYPKENIYDEKYSARPDLYKDVKIGYSTIPDHGAVNTMYNEIIQSQKSASAPVDIIRVNKMDPSNIINPSNSMTLKEQQASPNYARKCPQIFSQTDYGNTRTTHQSLYMSTPQFSSDKFTNIHAQRKIMHETEVKVRDCASDEVKMNKMSSLSGYTSQSGGSKYHHPQMHETTLQQSQLAPHHQEPLLNNVNPSISRSQNYYMPGAKSQITSVSEITPISVKQVQITSQYSKSPKALPPHTQFQPLSHLHHAAKSTTHDLTNFKKNEDIYTETPMLHQNSGLYANPYKRASPTDSCCKDIPVSYVNMSNSFTEHTGQHFYYKYGKMTKETVTKTHLCPENQNTPPPTPVHRTTGYKAQPYFYETQNIKYDGSVHNTNFNMSPSVAAVASPSPSQTTPPTHIQMHHTNLTPQSQSQSPANYTQIIRPPQHNQMEIHRDPVRTHSESTTIHPATNFCAYDRQQQSSKPIILHPVVIPPIQQGQPIDPPMQSKTISNIASQGQKANAIKKSQVPKTNYRELINQVYAMRSATSEKELDLQIIKKALNSATGPTGTPPIEKLPQSVAVTNNGTLPPPINPPMTSEYGMVSSENGFLVENVSTAPRNSQKICVKATLPDMHRTIKVEERSSSSPLDLSMRTVKTKADSTEYCYSQTLMKNHLVDYKHALPRVNFTPNFSLHSNDRTAVPKIVINQQSPHLKNLPEAPKATFVPVGSKGISVQSQSTHHQKQYLTEDTSRACIVTQHSELAPITDIKPNSMAFKTSDDGVMSQVRPSVVESNPFATVKLIKSEPNSMNDRNVLATADNFKPTTNIMQLPKPLLLRGTETACVPAYYGGVIKTADKVTLVEIDQAPNSLNKAHANEQRNPNYLGRKRHLQEYSNSQRNEPLVKQTRYQEQDGSPKVKLLPITSTSTTVIALNDRAIDGDREREQNVKTGEKFMQSELIPCCQRESSIIINNNIPICKIEPLTPAMDTPAPPVLHPVQMVPIKTETNSVIAARIRTKAELKGFTFNIPIDVVSTVKEPIQIKEEPSTCQTSNSDLPSIPGLDQQYDSISLLDFSWNNKCTDFMEQLLTSSLKKCSKRRPGNNITHIVEGCQISSNAKDVPLEHSTQNVESTESSKSSDMAESVNDSAMRSERTAGMSPEGHSSQSAIVVMQKKISKQDRGKIRLQQEKRIAARLQVDSSSESDDEIHKRKTDRSKKSLKKAKARQSPQADINQYSDCGSDSSDTNYGGNSPAKVPPQTIDKSDVNSNSKTKSKVIDIQETIAKAEFRDKCQNNATKNTILISGEPQSSESEDSPKSSSKISQKGETQNINKCKEVKQEKAEKVAQKISENKEEIGKGAKKPKVLLKVGLNTMTRSKRKREMELQLANSKVLRNDKIIRNSTTKMKSIKRKYVRKFVNNQTSVSAVCKELSNKQSDRELSMRLRSRNEKDVKGGGKTEKVPVSNNKKTNKATIAVDKDDCQNGKHKVKERPTDLFLEVYRYKRSLKIPPNLITIEHPHNLKMAASLPDLEIERDFSAASTNRSAKFAKSIEKLLQKSTPNISEKSSLTSKTEQEQQLHEERRSIIDVLHSRVIKTKVSASSKPKSKKSASNFGIGSQVHSDVSHSAESSSVMEMLSIPMKKEQDEESSDGKKRHFSIFETTVLKTKTRTESKMQQRKEIIREIFVGDDRPASAPPEIITQMSDGNEKMTFEQKYEQFLQHYIVINDDKLRKNGKASTVSSHSVADSISASTSTANHGKVNINDEEDTLASNGVAETLDTSAGNKANFVVDVATSSFRRRRPGKYLRRKGSSGFDYIRKKKKPNPTSSMNLNSTQNLQILVKLDRRTEDENYEKKVKTESDVRREIGKWVLNKSVGQTTVHKAARLGYIDVVVYCLDRMGINPDQKDNAGYTPLHEACTKGWLEIARILLQYGANHSEAAHSGIRPLHEASENDHEEIVRLLLSYGADPLLATYSGQTPLMLASSTAMRDLLNNHLSDVQNVGPDKKPWHFRGPWEILDSSIYGYDIFGGAPNFICDMSRALRKSSVSNSITNKKQLNSYVEAGNNCKTMMENCAVVLDNIGRFNSVRLYNDNKPEILVENSDSEGEIFEFEEADILLPPLYLLKDEGTDKWVLLSDLCNLLKVKSKDTLLNKIYPPSSSASSAHKSLMRELKLSDFLERATCLQLLCAGEKINICASKVVLIKYNDSVRNLLGVKTILMKF
ncbi:PREDICTED: uncharacterized protein LOC108360368 [Rhagoletis zephyria]|uniref:uncharacterized protein LOC108360368 n=1 Tax=Rhagoletis zephyria TaxID=28612 RepID=UPI00081152B3|nr:PREDICTED: uncharacterized protein LOC108360368 [Rhagoletis zephyria]